MPDRHKIYIGIDVGKTEHHACIIDELGSVLLSRRIINDQHNIETLIDQGAAIDSDSDLTWAIDLTSDIATVLITTLLNKGQHIKYVPGVLVNNMSRTFRGEGKTDARDAKVIAETLRMRGDLATVSAPDDIVNALAVLTDHREDLNAEWVAGINRIRALIVSIFPGLERALTLTSRTALTLISHACTPAQIREAGTSGLTTYLREQQCWPAGITRTANKAVAAAEQQSIVVPGEADIAAIIKRSALRLLILDREIKNLDKTITARFRSHHWARSIESIPGIGPILGAEFLAATEGRTDTFRSSGHLASYAGLVPVPRDSGRVHGNLRRPQRYNRRLRRVFYLAAFASLAAKSESWHYYQRKRTQGHKHNQAIICLARRLVDVLWALIRDNRQYEPRHLPPEKNQRPTPLALRH